MVRRKFQFRLITLMALVTVAAVVFWGVLHWQQVQRLRELVRRLGHDDATVVRGAFDELVRMDRASLRELVRGAINRDPKCEQMRGSVATRGAFAWLAMIERVREKSNTERAADHCLVALLSAWNKGWLPREQQKQLLPYLERFSALPPKTGYAAGESINFEVANHLPVAKCAVGEELWVKHRMHVVVDGTVQQSVNAHTPQGWINHRVVADESPVGPKIIVGTKGGTFAQFVVATNMLKPGVHHYSVAMRIGPGTANTELAGHRRETVNEPPPWFIDVPLAAGEFEIVDTQDEHQE